VPTPAPTPVPTPIELNLSDSIGEDGVVTETIEQTFADGAASIKVPEGTIALSSEGTPLEAIEVVPVDEPPEPPADTNVIGLAYDFGPDGATFDPPITITLVYDPALLPEGVAEEDLVIAYFDVGTGTWRELECVVDPATNTITAQVIHFTVFAILAEIPKPASFSVSNLTLSPAEAVTGESVTITAVVKNNGDLPGTYTATLKVNGVAEETKEVSLPGGASTTVSFTITRDVRGSYNVELGNQLSGLTVQTAPAGVGWSLVGGIIAAALVISIIIAYILARKRGVLTS